MTIEYLSGFFDGEGTIRIKKRRQQSDVVQLQIGQKEEAVLYEIKSQFGGWIESGGQTGQVKRWVITGKKAQELARQMLPHLVVKKKVVLDTL